MDLQTTKAHFHKAKNNLLENDSALLRRDLSERSIAHKLAYYLTLLFKNYDVDCEYNGDVDSEGLRKILEIPQEVMEDLTVRSVRENDTYNIFPDIIIHERGTNTRNHVVFEMKKRNTNYQQKEYDFVKLKTFTLQYNYRLGIYIEVQTGENPVISEIRYFQKGEERTESQLEEL